MLPDETDDILVSLRHEFDRRYSIRVVVYVPICSGDGAVSIHMGRPSSTSIGLSIVLGRTAIHCEALLFPRWRANTTVFTLCRGGQTCCTDAVVCTSYLIQTNRHQIRGKCEKNPRRYVL